MPSSQDNSPLANESSNDLSAVKDSETVVEPRPIDSLPVLGRLEAVLFLASTPLSSRKLAHFAELEDGTQARTLVKQLNQKYDETGRSFHIKQIAGGYQLMTRPQFSTWLRRLEHVPAGLRLSTPAMETLSVIAYRQPILKAEIEAVRGVSCGEMLRQLLERGLVKIAGRSEELGRPYFYATTNRFLEMFGLSNLDALPRATELKGRGLPKTILPSQNETDTLDPSSDACPTNSEELNVSVEVSPLVLDPPNENNPELDFDPAVDQRATSPVAETDEDDDDEEDYEDDEYEADDDDEDEDGDYEYDDDVDEDDVEDDDADDIEEEDDDDDSDDWEDEEDDEELEDHWEEVDDDDEEWEDDDSSEDWDDDDDDDDEDDEAEDDFDDEVSDEDDDDDEDSEEEAAVDEEEDDDWE